MSVWLITLKGQMTEAHKRKLSDRVFVQRAMMNVTNRQERHCRIGDVWLKSDAPINH